MEDFQQLLIETRGAVTREQIARRCRSIPDGVPLDERQIKRIETELSRPPTPDVVRTLIAAYGLNHFAAAAALGVWPPTVARRCSFAEFQAFTNAYDGLRVRLDIHRGVAVVEGVET